MDPDKQLHKVLLAIQQKQAFHIQLEGIGKLIFNRVTPYLFLYRIPASGRDPVLNGLGRTEPTSFIAKNESFDFAYWVKAICNELADVFGSCLLVEIWSAEALQKNDISIHLAQKNSLGIAEDLQRNLQAEARDFPLSVELVKSNKFPKPKFASPIFSAKDQQSTAILVLGIAVKNNYIDRQTGQWLPILLRQYRETISKSLAKTFFEFVRIHTRAKVSDFRILHQTQLNPWSGRLIKNLPKRVKGLIFYFWSPHSMYTKHGCNSKRINS